MNRKKLAPVVAGLVGSAIALVPLYGVMSESPPATADSSPFPLNETFTDGTPDNPNWVAKGDADLTPDDGGWLQLTDSAEKKAGAYVLNEAFPATQGIVAEFDYNISQPGGKHPPTNTKPGGDGFSLFFVDGTKEPSVGAYGAGLGYSCLGPKLNCNVDGVTGGYLGVGFDVYGNFSGQTAGTGKAPGQTPGQVVVRGSGSGTSGFAYLEGASAPRLQLADSSVSRRVRVTIAAGTISVALTDPGGTLFKSYIEHLKVAGIGGQAALPETFKVGFAASTGSAWEEHRIRNLTIALPTDLAIAKSGPSEVAQGGDVAWTLSATNNGVNDAPGSTIIDQVPAGVDNVEWTCTASAGGKCSEASGSGNDVRVPADLPKGGKVTVKVTGTVTATEGTDLGNTATVTPSDEFTDTSNDNNTATSTSKVGPPVSDIAWTTSEDPGKSVTVTLTNNGPSPMTKPATTTVTLPPGTFAKSVPPDCTLSADKTSVTCTTQPTLDPDAKQPYEIPLGMKPGTPAGKDLPGGTVVGEQPDDPNSSNNDPSLPFDSGAGSGADLTYKLSSNDAESFTLTVVNNGPDDLTQNATVTVTLPQKAILEKSFSDQCVGVSGQSSFLCTVPAPLGAGQAQPYDDIHLVIDNSVQNGDSLTGGQVSIADTGDPNQANNSGSFGFDVTGLKVQPWGQRDYTVSPVDD